MHRFAARVIEPPFGARAAADDASIEVAPEIQALDNVGASGRQMPRTAMSPLAHRTIEADLDRLERQRLGYAQALASSQDDRARARHERTLSRLDEEIEALHGALHAIVDARGPAWQRVDTDAVPLLEQTAELTAAEYDALQPRRAAWLWPVLGAAALALVGGLWLATRSPPTPPPATAPPAVIVSSPVPPDSDAAPAR